VSKNENGGRPQDVGGRLQGPRKPKPLYRKKPPKPPKAAGLKSKVQSPKSDFPHAHVIAPSHFTLREDGSIQAAPSTRPSPTVGEKAVADLMRGSAPQLIFQSDAPFIRIYHGNALELLDAIAAKYPDGRFDAIFADPPYFLSNGGITCHAGRMVKVDKGDWDKSRGPELNHEFNTEWLRRCQRVLKPDGTIWVTGTLHVIFSVGYAMQQLGFRILNDIAWEKPNPPPNLGCRCFTHSTETVLWAAKNDKSKHTFNYAAMKAVTGKQMKTVWRREEFEPQMDTDGTQKGIRENPCESAAENVWTLPAPGRDEKEFGKHPTQKPVALVERCLLASTNPGDLVLDPFLGSGTTAVACIRLNRRCVGIEMDLRYLDIAAKRADREIVLIWLRNFRVRIEVRISSANDLDLFADSINGSRRVDDKPEIQTDCIWQECKFVFLSCAQVSRASVVHTTVDVSLQEAWAKTPTGKKRETTHIVRCQTEIFRVKN
jgi:site-specific DNA-methyltransferase (adenine-specific)